MAISHGEPNTIFSDSMRDIKGKIVETQRGKAWKASQRGHYGGRVLKVVPDDLLDRSVRREHVRKGPTYAKEGRQYLHEWKVRILVRLEFGDKSIYGDTENKGNSEPALVMLWNFILSSYKEQLKDLLSVPEG